MPNNEAVDGNAFTTEPFNQHEARDLFVYHLN